MNRKKTTLLLLSLFAGIILLLGILWLWMYSSSGSSDRLTNEPSTYSISDLPLPELPDFSETVKNTDRQQAFQIQQETHQYVKETAQSLLQQEIISLDQIVEWNKSLERTDQLIKKRDYPAAIKGYQQIKLSVSEIAERERWKKKADTLQTQLKQALDTYKNRKRYAPVPYEIAEDLFKSGRKQLKADRYPVAAQCFQQGLDQLATIDGIVKQFIEQSLDTVTAALIDLDIKTAQKALKEVLALAPENETALRLQDELDQVEKIAGDLKTAMTAMEQGDYQQSIDAYQRVLKTQPNLLTAQAGLEQARAALLEQQVRPLINQAQKLFSEKKYEESLKLLKQALTFAPDEISIQEAIADVQSAWKAHRLQSQLDEAYAHYEKNDWKAARKVYLKILEDHPENPEAQQGSAETSKQLAAEIKYRSAMRLAENYARAGQYPESIRSFNAALGLRPAHLKLTESQNALQKNLEKQREEQTITLYSDSRTWVSIIGSMPPERFSRKTIKLYPDVYKVVGRRDGYQDISFELRVDAIRPKKEITVKCTERK